MQRGNKKSTVFFFERKRKEKTRGGACYPGLVVICFNGREYSNVLIEFFSHMRSCSPTSYTFFKEFYPRLECC